MFANTLACRCLLWFAFYSIRFTFDRGLVECLLHHGLRALCVVGVQYFRIMCFTPAFAAL
jgi:hypothetical protein